MLWHIVKFRFREDVDWDQRAAIASELAALGERIDEIRFLRVARSEEPGVLGLLSGFDDVAALDRYRAHPAHVPVSDRTASLCSEIVRLDVVTEDSPDALPRLPG